MKKLKGYCNKTVGLLVDMIKHRKLYGSVFNNAYVFWLRLAATRPGRRLLSVKPILLLIPNFRFPLHLRRGTSDILVLQEILEYNAYEPARHWPLHEGKIVDLGGNIGLATLYLASVFPKANFVIVEPDAANCQMIRKNCEHLLKEHRAEVVHAFVGATDGYASVDRSNDCWSYRKMDLPSLESERVECLSIPSLLERVGWKTMDFLKCDIEGSEAELFASCEPWIKSVRFLFVETHQPYSLPQLHRDLGQANWKFRTVRESNDSVLGQCFLEKLND